MICPSCAHTIDPSDKFCRNCGAALAPAAERTGVASTPPGSATLADLASEFAKKLADTPENATAQYNLGLALLYQGSYAEAAANLAAVTEKEPEFADAFEKLAIALQRLGDIPAAVAALQRAVDLDPDNARLRSALTRLLPPNS